MEAVISTLGIIVGALAAIGIIYLFGRSDGPPSTDGMVIKFGFGVAFFDEDNIEPTRAREIVDELDKIALDLWPRWEALYGTEVRKTLDTIHLVTKLTVDGIDKPAQGRVPRGKLYLDITKNYRRSYGAELYNYFRAALHSPYNVYCDEAVDSEDKRLCLAGQKLWKRIV